MRKILNSYILASFLLVSLTTFLWTCNGGGGGGGSSPDNTAPTVTSTSPDNNAVNVSIVAAISATFSEEMDSSTVNDTNFTVADGGGPVAGTVSYSGTTATFTPTDPLEPSTPYTATVSTGVTDKAGNALAQDYTWSFTTGAAPIGFTPEMLTGKAFASINEQQNGDYDNWVIQFDATTYEFWEAEYTFATDTLVPTEGQGTWSISNGELIADFPGNATITLQDETNEYIDVQINDGSNPPESARMYKTDPFVEADVSGQTFDYGGGITEEYLADGTGTNFFNGVEQYTFDWTVDANGVLVQTYSDNYSEFGYRLVNNDPNIVFVEFDDTGAFDDIYSVTFTVVP